MALMENVINSRLFEQATIASEFGEMVMQSNAISPMDTDRTNGNGSFASSCATHYETLY